MENVIKSSVLSPRFCCLRFHNVLANSADPTSSNNVNATCPATRTLRKRTCPSPADALEPCSFSICETPLLATRQAGIRPKRIADATVAAAANPKMLPSIVQVTPSTQTPQTTAWVKTFISQTP